MAKLGIKLNADEFLAAARRFRDEHVRPNAQAWEHAQSQPVDALRQAASAGLFKLETPEAAGGFGLPFTTKLQFCEDMSRADMPFVFALINTQNIAVQLSGFPHLRDLYVDDLLAGRLFGATALTEPTTGSDFGAVAMTAERVDGGWALTGEKAWITNAGIADLFVVFAQTDAPGNRDGIQSFLIDARRDGFSRTPGIQLLGGHGIGAGGFKLSRHFVPDDHVLSGEDKSGFKAAMQSINGARVYVAAMCVGMVADALDQTVAYTRRREAFGQPLIGHQGLRWKLADVSTELAAMRTLTNTAGQLIDDGGNAVLLAAQAKKFATERAVRLIETCMQCEGANGLREDNNLGRHLAGAKILGYTDGTIEMMNERVGASLMKS